MHSFDELGDFLKRGDTLVEWHGRTVRLSRVSPKGDGLIGHDFYIEEGMSFNDIAFAIGEAFFRLHAPQFLIPDKQNGNPFGSPDSQAPR